MNAVMLQAISERDFQGLVVTFAKFNGWQVHHQLESRGSEPGWPDLVLLRDGEAVFAELKKENGKLTAAQEKVLALLRSAGLEAHVWRPSSWDEIQLRLGRRPS